MENLLPRLLSRISYLITLFLLGCSHIQFVTNDEIPLALGPERGHAVLAQKEGERAFYLWGFLPRSHIVDVDAELSSTGLTNGARVSVEEYQTVGSAFLTILTFGMYIPKKFRISAYGVKDDFR